MSFSHNFFRKQVVDRIKEWKHLHLHTLYQAQTGLSSIAREKKLQEFTLLSCIPRLAIWGAQHFEALAVSRVPRKRLRVVTEWTLEKATN